MLTFEDKLEAARNDGREEGIEEGRLAEREVIILEAFNKYANDCNGTPSFDEFMDLYGFIVRDEFVDYVKNLFIEK